MVHRDLKPTNVLFAADGTPKVADFGLAKLLDAETGQTRTGDVLGTPCYMAPEQASGDAGRIGPRTDVYGLGAMLYELLHGKPPYRGADRKAILARVLHGQPEAPAAKIGKDQRGLAAICGKCLEKDPRDRYPSAAALAEDLDRWLQHGRPEAKQPGPLVRTGRFVRRRTFLAGSLAVCGLGATAGLAGWWWSPRPVDPDAAIKEIERRLARGEAVELIGSGPTSAPAWSRVAMGTAVTDRSDKGGDHAFRLLSDSPGGWLELVRDPQTDRYVIRAEIRHETDQGYGFVGLYFGRREYPTTAGDVQVRVQTCFNDVHSRGDDIRHSNQDHPEKPPRRVPKANEVQVETVWGPESDSPNPIRDILGSCELVQPAMQWRSIAVKVTPAEVQLAWEGVDQPALSFPTAQVGERIRTSLSRFNRPNPFPGGTVPSFDPRGSIGLYVYVGAASFRNVRIEPLGSAD